jgi:RNA polymerase sigma-70 factor (ECF subfamily)
MQEDSSVHKLMAGLQAQDDAAARQLFQRYAERLIDLARHNLQPLMRPKMDPEDVAQSVFQSFFIRQRTGEFTNVETWESLWKVLVTLTLRKCGRRVDYFYADCRDIHREVSQVPKAQADESNEGGWEGRLADPTAEEAAMLTEALEVLMSRLSKDEARWGEQHRQILALRLQGYEPEEISTQLGCAERTVYRVMKRAKEILSRMQAEGD